MAEHCIAAPSGPSNILAFPKPKHPRRAGHINSFGEHRLKTMRSAGEPVPDNVEPLHRPKRITVSRSPELAFVLAIWATLDDAHRGRVRFQIDLGAERGEAEFQAIATLLDGRR